MKEITIRVKIYDTNNIEKYKQLFDDDPIFFVRNGNVGAIWGDHNYDLEIADFLNSIPPEEIQKIKNIAKINSLKRQIQELEDSI